MLRSAWVVYLKELVDALRDRRTLAIVLLSSVAIGPLVLVLISRLVGDVERRAEAREIVIQGIEHAPGLANFLARQTYSVKAAPADHEAQLRRSALGEPVVVVPPDFESRLQRGEAATLEVVYAAANRRAQGAVNATAALLRGYGQEQAGIRLALRGVAPSLVEPLEVQLRDLSDASARSAQLTQMLPFFVLMAVLYGALNAALDTTAGERERGSLEPLLMTPPPRLCLVLGKWAAVASVAMLIAVLSCASFLPGQWLLRSEVLAAMFRYGWREALWFIGLLAPLAAALSALLMAIAIRCRSFKEAQANATVVMLAVSMLPLVSVMNQEGEARWHLWTPGLAQSTLMGRVLRGEALPPLDLLIPVGVAAAISAAALWFVARTLKAAPLK